MSQLPTGTVTFLFTDIEGSTQSWDEHPDAMRAALERHDALMRQAVEANAGQVFKTVGDAFCAAFATAGAAWPQPSLPSAPSPPRTGPASVMASHRSSSAWACIPARPPSAAAIALPSR